MNNTFKNGTLEDFTVFDTTPISFWTAHVAYPIIAFVGMFGNGLVLFVFHKTPSLTSKLSSVLVIHQSIVDFLTSFFLLTSSFTEWYLENSTMLYELPSSLKDFYCKFIARKLLVWIGFLVSIYNLVFLSFERYISISYPLWHKRLISRNKLKISVIILWCVCITYAAIYQSLTTRFIFKRCMPFSKFNSNLSKSLVGILNICIFFIFPLIILSYSYGKMLFIFTKRINPDEGSIPKMEAKYNRIRKNTIKTFAIVSIAFVLCYVWNQFYFLLQNLGLNLTFDTPFYRFTIIASFLNCCVNPFIYLIKYEQFIKALRRIFTNVNETSDQKNS